MAERPAMSTDYTFKPSERTIKVFIYMNTHMFVNMFLYILIYMYILVFYTYLLI
jgi:hypothetical protein